MPVTKELVASVRERVAESPAVLTSTLAKEFSASEVDVILSLPLSMRLRGRLSDIASIWEDLSAWRSSVVNVTTLTEDSFIKKALGLHNGKWEGHSFEGSPVRFASAKPNFNEVHFIWFVSKPLFGAESYSVQFFDRLGTHIVSVYAGRDEFGRIEQETKRSFDIMKQKYGIIPVPKNRCQGCQGCSCNKDKVAKCTH